MWEYRDAIDEALGEDEMAQPLKNLFDEESVHTVTKQEIRNGLTNLCRDQLDTY